MIVELIEHALGEIKRGVETAIASARFDGKKYENGQKAKEALIRSSRLIQTVHEATKASLHAELARRSVPHSVHPPLGRPSPELNVTGFIKKKKQDVVVLIGRDEPTPETIVDGPLEGATDALGKSASESSIVVGVRSQLSSVAKNFDTLMERAFAETLNLRLRFPMLVMGEVYLLPIYEYDDSRMTANAVAFKSDPVPLGKFIRTFAGISGRGVDQGGDIYKYERTALILADFRRDPPAICTTEPELVRLGVPADLAPKYAGLSPVNFAADLVDAYSARHGSCFPA